jgi:hypothetical protein
MQPSRAIHLDLNGRRILVISPRYFGYEKRIVDHLAGRGALVEWLDERPGNSTLFKALTRLRSGAMAPIAERYYASALAQLAGRRFDDVLFINPESSTPEIVRRFRSSFPGSRLLLYMWDSFDNKPRADTPGFIRLFDRALTFDPVDADEHGITFRPLFYSDDAGARAAATHDLAFSFVGTIHSDRYRVLRAICRQADEAGLPYLVYPYLQSRLLYGLYRLTKREFRGTRAGDFRYEPMPYPEVLRVLASSTAVVDVEHPRQRGLTMRTLEVLGSGKKLVTTNARVRAYPFFSEDRIWVLDRRDLKVDPHFFRKPAPPLPAAYAAEYSLTGWADAILG